MSFINFFMGYTKEQLKFIIDKAAFDVGDIVYSKHLRTIFDITGLVIEDEEIAYEHHNFQFYEKDLVPVRENVSHYFRD